LRFSIEGRSYLDGIDITANDIYRLLPRARELPTTSAPTPGDYYAVMQRTAQESDSILVITIADRFSGMYQSAVLAASAARESLVGVSVEVVDCGTAAGGQGLVVLAAARVAAAGATLSETAARAREVMRSVDLVATLETLYYLARSGRVPMAVHWANAVVRVNPLLRISPLSGEAKTVRLARGRESAVRQLLQLVEQCVAERALHGIIFHSYRLQEAECLRERVEAQFDCRELHISDFTPAMGIHTGPGVLGLAYYSD
jgi:DegV family protein with EDD domain